MIMIILMIIPFIIEFLLGYFIYSCKIKKRLVIVKDTITPSNNRVGNRLLNDCVMKLKDEIIKSDCLKLKRSNSSIDIELKIFKD